MVNKKITKKNRFIFIAAIILLVYGIIETLDCLSLVLVVAKVIENPYPTFVFQELEDMMNNHTLYMIPVFLVFTSMRLLAAVGLLLNRMWGFWMGIFVSGVTFCVMILFLPLGALDGVISVAVVTFLLIGYCGKQKIAMSNSIFEDSVTSSK